MRSRLEKAIDKRDDCVDQWEKWGWGSSAYSAKIRAHDREERRLNLKVENLGGNPRWSNRGLSDRDDPYDSSGDYQ